MEKVKLQYITNNLDNRRIPLNSIQRSAKTKIGLYPYVGANNIQGYIDEYIFDEKILCIAEDGGSWGKDEKCAVIINEKCWVNNHAHVLTAKDNLVLEYLMYYLNYSDLSLYINGATRGKLTQKALNNLEIPLPNLATQQRIAAILDQADAIIQNNRAIVQKYDALTQSLFLEMFGDPVKNEKGYKIVKLIDVSTKITDGVHAKPEYTESGVPFISVKDITTGSLTFENCKFISNEAHQKYYKRCNPEYDDILYTKVGATYGRPAIVDVEDEFSLYVSVALIKPNRELINPKYLKDALGNPAIKRQADKAIKGIGVPDLHLNMIKEFLLPLPTLEEQNEFESRVIAIEAQKQQAQLELAKSEELFQSLLQRAFKGELN